MEELVTAKSNSIISEDTLSISHISKVTPYLRGKYKFSKNDTDSKILCLRPSERMDQGNRRKDLPHEGPRGSISNTNT